MPMPVLLRLVDGSSVIVVSFLPNRGQVDKCGEACKTSKHLKDSKSSIPQKSKQAATRQTGQRCPSLLKDLSDKHQKCLARKDWECDYVFYYQLREREHIARCWGTCCMLHCYTSCHLKHLKWFAFRTPPDEARPDPCDSPLCDLLRWNLL